LSRSLNFTKFQDGFQCLFTMCDREEKFEGTIRVIRTRKSKKGSHLQWPKRGKLKDEYDLQNTN